MEQRTFSGMDHNTFVLKVHGNLELTGWDQPEIDVQADQHTLRVEEDGSTVRLVALRNCRLTVPAGKKVQLEKVGGNAWLHNYHSSIEGERVSGNLVVEDVPDVQVVKVSGDLAARRISNLTVGRVGGDCVVEAVSASLQIGKVGGQLQGQQVQKAAVERVGGDAALQADVMAGRMRAGGDVHVSLGTTSGSNVEISAGGDAMVQLFGGAHLNLNIHSGAHDIIINLAGKRSVIEERDYTYPMGAEMPSLSIEAGGDVRVNDEPWSQLNLAGRFEQAQKRSAQWDIPGFAETMQAVEQVVNQSQRIAEISSQAGQKAARQAEERVREVMRDLNMRFGGAPVTEEPVHGQAPETQQAPREPVPPGEPEADAQVSGVSEEERIFVLRMLQDKKITLEEAEQLLDALEGR